MARKLRLLTLAASLASLAVAVAEPQAGRPGQLRPGGPRPGDNTPEMQNVRRALEALPPEQRKRFAENLARWSNLSPEQKKVLGDHEEMRKKFMEEEIAVAVKETGLVLEGERREQFVRRFGEERRKIEEQLRSEMMEKRKPLVRDLIQRMKAEFSSPGRTPTATPASAR